MPRSVALTVELLSVEPGFWCRDCATSTGVLVWYVTTTSGASTLRTSAWCVECRGRNIEATD